jgi:hypothetical protein
LKTAAAVPAAIAAGAVVGDLASTAIAAIAHHAGVTQSFAPLQFATYTALSVLGVIGGAIGWQLVRNLATNPNRFLARLVPLVLVLSFIPDILVGITKAETATTWGGVIALMAMHVVVATAAVASYLYFLPVRPLEGRPQAGTEGVVERPGTWSAPSTT